MVTAVTCDMEDWSPQLNGGELALAQAMAHWTETGRKCGLEQNRNLGVNMYLWGTPSCILALCFGRVPALVQWAEDAAEDYKELTRDFDAQWIGILHARITCQVLVNIGRPAEAHAVLGAMGFTWSDEGFAVYDMAFVSLSSMLPGFDKDADAVLQRLLLYSASPQSTALDAEVGAWIPTPAAIAQHERDQTVTQFLFMGMLGLAASVFLRLGRDDDAAEAARILVSPEHNCIQRSDLAHGHSILGQVTAKRGDVDAADGHFGRALDAATASWFPLWVVIAARDWKRAVPESSGAADAVIGAACIQMGKSHSELELAGLECGPRSITPKKERLPERKESLWSNFR